MHKLTDYVILSRETPTPQEFKTVPLEVKEGHGGVSTGEHLTLFMLLVNHISKQTLYGPERP